MGLFDFIFKKKDVEKAYEYDSYFKTLTAYQPHFSTWNGQIYEAALVRAAIDARARMMSKLSVEMHGAAKPSLQAKLRLKPNDWQTWSQFLYRASTILDMHNTLVIVPVHDMLMNTIGYYPILPQKCEIVEAEGTPFLRYTFTNGQHAAEYLSECAVLTKFQYKNDFFGESNAALDPTMQMMHLNDESIKEAVKNGATYRFMAKVNNFLKTEDLKKERQRFNEANLKVEQGNGGLLLFPNTYTDIKQIDQHSFTVPEQERTAIERNIFYYFGVNEDVLKSQAFGDKWIAFYESVGEAFSIQFSEAMTGAIFSDREREFGNYLMATSNRMQFMTTKEKLEVSSQMADRGIMNRDEIREIWNLPPLPDGQGQAYTIRGEYYLLNEENEKEGVNDGNQE